MEIREFVPSDSEAVIELARELGLSPWSLEDYLNELRRDDSRMIVATAGESICGFLVGRLVPGAAEGELDAEIYNIGVSRGLHRLGIGSELMAEFLRHCRLAKAVSVWLEVRALNLGAIEFYETKGFARFALRPYFYRDPTDAAVIMRLTLQRKG